MEVEGFVAGKLGAERRHVGAERGRSGVVAERERSGESGGTNDASLRVTRSDAKLRERGGGDLRINRLVNESRVGLKIEIASKRLAICYGHLTMARIIIVLDLVGLLRSF